MLFVLAEPDLRRIECHRCQMCKDCGGKGFLEIPDFPRFRTVFPHISDRSPPRIKEMHEYILRVAGEKWPYKKIAEEVDRDISTVTKHITAHREAKCGCGRD